MKYDLVLSPHRLTYATKKAVAWAVGAGLVKPKSATFSWRDKVEIAQNISFLAAQTVIGMAKKEGLSVGEDLGAGKIVKYEENY